MSKVSQFFGIAIQIRFDARSPPSFFACYEDYEASICIKTLVALNGYLPKRAFLMVIEWSVTYRLELLEAWYLAKENKPLRQIKPLK